MFFNMSSCLFIRFRPSATAKPDNLARQCGHFQLVSNHALAFWVMIVHPPPVNPTISIASVHAISLYCVSTPFVSFWGNFRAAATSKPDSLDRQCMHNFTVLEHTPTDVSITDVWFEIGLPSALFDPINYPLHKEAICFLHCHVLLSRLMVCKLIVYQPIVLVCNPCLCTCRLQTRPSRSPVPDLYE